MPGSAAHKFFAIPELVLSLSAHAPKRDLAQCILVCKEWSRQFQPRLWMELDINDRFIELLNVVPSPTAAALAKNRGLIQEVNFSHANQPELQLLVEGLPDQLDDTVSEPSTLCTSLTRIDLHDLDSDNLDSILKPLRTLLTYNLRLTYLNVYVDAFAINGVTAALSKLRHLQHLTVHARYEDVTIPEPVLFLRSCLALPELTELHLTNGVEMYWDDGDESTIRHELEAIINEAAITRSSRGTNAKKIKQLTFSSNSKGRNNPLPLLLFKSNMLDLTTIEIPWFGPDASIHEIEQVVREHCCSVKHLKYLMYGIRENWNGQFARAFIRGCSGLQSFTSGSFDDCPDGAPVLALSEIVSHHHTTLELLDLKESDQVCSRDLQEVLSRCKQLKRYWVMGDMDTSISSINFWDICRSDWVCTELRELGLTIDRCLPEGIASDELEEIEQGPGDPHICFDACACVPKRAYRQIGRLKKLEVLKIGIDRGYRARGPPEGYAWDLTLSYGWLSELAGLKSLKSFRLGAGFWRAMGQAEVEFMHEQWPLLNEVTIWCGRSPLSIEPHWQWLLDKRPQLRFAPEAY